MMNDIKNIQSFYHDQNIQIRKQIRQMDMQYKQLISNSKISLSQKQSQLINNDIQFIVIGPNKSGKSYLLKTMYFALNSNFNIQINTSQLPGTVIKRFDIKKNKKYQIQGLSKIKQTQQKRTISAFQFQDKSSHYSNKQQHPHKQHHSNNNNNYTRQQSSNQKSSKIFQKYSNALQLIDNRVFGCFKTSISNNQLFNNSNLSYLSIRTVLIVINIFQIIQFQQISCLKFFLADIKQKGIKTLIILTHIDKLNHLKENQKLMFIQERINMLKKQLEIQDRDDFICLQNYHEHNDTTSKTKNSQFSKHQLSQTKSNHTFQSNSYSNQSYMNQQKKYNPSGVYQYKKVSQFYQHDSPLQMQIPILSKQQKGYQTVGIQPQYQLSQNSITASRSISCNTTQDNRYAKVSSKNINSSTNIPSNIQQNYSAKKSSHNIYKPLYQNSQQSNQSQIQIPNFKNSQQINYYSLKLLIKILKQSQKYVNRELKQKKLIKWFCG